MTRYRSEPHDQPITYNEPKGPKSLAPRLGVQHDNGTKEVADADTIKHAVIAPCWVRTARCTPKYEPQEKKHNCSDHYVHIYFLLAACLLKPLVKGVRHCHPDDEDEKWKDQIPQGKAMPLWVTALLGQEVENYIIRYLWKSTQDTSKSYEQEHVEAP